MTAIVSIGHVARDIVADGQPRPGGTVFFSARALAALGADASVAAACASSDRDLLLTPLEALGLPVTWYESATTAAYTFRYDGDRRVMSQDGVGEPWSQDRALAAAGDAEWIHVGALTRTDFPPSTLAALAVRGRKLLVDAQGLVRTPELGPLRTDREIGDALRHVAILKLDADEASTLAGSGEPDALRALGVPEVLLTLGSRGSFVITQDETEHVAAQPVAGPVDPTGAGDTLSAAYLTARADGLDPIAAARRATMAVAAFLSGE